MTLRLHADDPSARLEACFARIERERMQGVPLLNPALHVQVAAVERWDGQWLATLVTPWFLNLVLLPGDAGRWRTAPEGTRVYHRFAAGELAFLGSEEPELGAFQACSLISPMGQFAAQAAAVATARAALQMLHVAPAAPAMAPVSPQASAASTAAPQPAPATAPRPAPAAGGRPARRVFLFGRA
jgi:[NiFe] hydrogenase assembly HybE family chaperone